MIFPHNDKWEEKASKSVHPQQLNLQNFVLEQVWLAFPKLYFVLVTHCHITKHPKS
jgi:hypothetical protein